MSKKSTAKARLELNAQPFIDAANRAADVGKGLGNVLRSAVGSAMGNIAAIGFTNLMQTAARATFGNVAATFKLAEEMATLSKRTGLAAESIEAYKFALEKGITVDQAKDLLGDRIKALGENADAFRTIAIKLDAAGMRFQAFWIGVAEEFAPIITLVLDRLEELDLADWGSAFAKPIADTISGIYEMAQDGDLWTFLGDALKAGLQQAGNVIVWLGDLTWNTLSAVFKGLGKYFGETLKWELEYAAARLSLIVAKNAGQLGDLDYNKVVATLDDAMSKRRGSLAKEFADPVKEAWSNTKMQDVFGFKDTAARVAKVWTAAVDEGTKKAKDAYQKVKDNPTGDTRVIKGVFGNVDSLQSIGGGGGVGTGLVGVLQETQRQTYVMEQIRDLLGVPPATQSIPARALFTPALAVGTL